MSEHLPDLHRRASDADRDAVAERLRDAAGDGRPTTEVEGPRRRELGS